MQQQKTLKQLCKEAKNRLKSGFWQKHYEEVEKEVEKAKEKGIPEAKVREYMTAKVLCEIRGYDLTDEELFYQKVKKILIEEGEVSNAIGRLTDKDEFEKLFNEYKITHALLYNDELINQYISEDEEWTRIYQDDRFSLYEKNNK